MPDRRDFADLLGEPPSSGMPAAPHPRLPPAIEQLLFDAHARPDCAPEQAQALCEDAVARARAGGDAALLARTLLAAGTLTANRGRFDRAHALAVEAATLLEQIDDPWRSARSALLRARCWLGVGEHERAAPLALEAAERLRQLDDRPELARSLATLAQVHCCADDLAGALVAASRAVAIAGALGATAPAGLVATTRVVAAAIHLEQGHRHAAAELLRPVLDPVLAGACSGAVARVVLAAVAADGDGPGLPAALRRLGARADGRHSAAARGLAWLHLAELQHQRGRTPAALPAARAAARWLAQSPAEPRAADACFLLAELLEAGGQPRAAYEACCEGMRLESERERERLAMRADLVALAEDARHAEAGAPASAPAQRMSNVGRLVAGVNHELNQPMASIRMLAGTTIELLAMGERAEARDGMRAMLALSTRLNGLAAQLAAFPAPGAAPAQGARVGLRAAVEEALRTLGSRLAATPCEMVLDLDDAAVTAVPAQLVSVIANLVHNALDVLEPQGRRRVRFASADRDGRRVLSITDNGPGLSHAVQARLFQPFFSTKGAGSGLGLGLALSRDALREMGGDLALANAPGGGVVCELVLPPA